MYFPNTSVLWLTRDLDLESAHFQLLEVINSLPVFFPLISDLRKKIHSWEALEYPCLFRGKVLHTQWHRSNMLPHGNKKLENPGSTRRALPSRTGANHPTDACADGSARALPEQAIRCPSQRGQWEELRGLTGSPASAVTSRDATRRHAKQIGKRGWAALACVRERRLVLLRVVGDGRQARRPALAEWGRCGECVLAPAPVLGGGVRQLLVIRETSPVRGGVGQPQTTGWSSKGPDSWCLRCPPTVARLRGWPWPVLPSLGHSTRLWSPSFCFRFLVLCHLPSQALL